MAGMAGFEPTDARVKVWCLTAWRHPNIHNNNYYTIFVYICQVFFYFMMQDRSIIGL